MAEFVLTAGDTLPVLTSTLADDEGLIPLTGATVTLRMRRADGSTVLEKVAQVVSDGKVRYAWKAGDTNDPGVFFAEWRIVYPEGGRLTVPNEYPIIIRTRARLEDLPAVDAALIGEIRARIGSASPPTDSDLMASYEALGSVDKVVLSVLETRLSALLSKPAKYTIEGDSSFDWSANLQALKQEVASLRAETGAAGLTIGRLVKTWNR